MIVYYKNIPTRFADGTWGYTKFETLDEFRQFVKGSFKEPGKYGFDETTKLFNEHATHFLKTGIFCTAPQGSRDYFKYWDTQKERCKKGIIMHGLTGQVWFLCREYYQWLNFLQLYNTVKKKFEFPGIRDTQYHIALYELLAELYGKHVAFLKKRQLASSYYHMAKVYNRHLFESGYTTKITASDKKYIDTTNGCWKFLNEYHNFTNKHTAWPSINTPDKAFSWQQKVETKTPDGRKVEIGNMSTISGISCDKDPKAVVGGATNFLFYEEGGIAPTADQTYGYIRAAMRQGTTITGTFVIAGSVGDLSQCEPLKDFVLNPDANDFYAIESNLLDEHGTIGMTALFVPEQWSLTGEGDLNFTDEYGNSKVEEALDYLNKDFARLKAILSPEKYQLEISQRPRNIQEAFAMRSISVFPVQHTSSQEQRIKDNEYSIEYVELIRNDKNEIEAKESNRRPITEYPISMKEKDKKGVVCIHKHPAKGSKLGFCVGAIDPVEVGKTEQSTSVTSIYIYELDHEVVTEQLVTKDKSLEGHRDVNEYWGAEKERKPNTELKVTSHLEGGKIVAWWAGRYDDVNETNEMLSRLVEYYNAKVVCENNKGSFINYMIGKRRQKYLTLREEMTFDKELYVEQKTFQKYGITMTTKLKEYALDIAVDSLSEVLHEETDEKGDVVRIHYGVERIPDIMLIQEMKVCEKGKNADRLVAYCLMMAYVKVLLASGKRRKSIDQKGLDDKLENRSKNSNFIERGLFQNIGKKNYPAKIARSPFRHMGKN